MRTAVPYYGTPSHANVTETQNVAMSSDQVVVYCAGTPTTVPWIQITAKPSASREELQTLPEWLTDKKPVKVIPNRAQRRAIKRGKQS